MAHKKNTGIGINSDIAIEYVTLIALAYHQLKQPADNVYLGHIKSQILSMEKTHPNIENIALHFSGPKLFFMSTFHTTILKNDALYRLLDQPNNEPPSQSLLR